MKESSSTIVAGLCKIENKAQNGFHHVQFIATYLFLYAGYGVLIPYLPVYFDSLRISAVNIGILGMIPNIAAFTCAPLWSLLGDSFNIRSEIMLGTMVGSILCTFLFLIPSSLAFVFLVVSVGAVFRAPLSPLVDSLVMLRLKDNTDYGKMRLWGAVGFGVFSFIGGMLSTTSSDPEQSVQVDACVNGSCFRSNFYVYGGLGLVTLMIFWSLRQSMLGPKLLISGPTVTNKLAEVTSTDIELITTVKDVKDIGGEEHQNELETEEGEESTAQLFSQVIRSQPSVLLFALVIFLSGMGTGVIETFLFIRLKELGASGLVMGSARLLTCVAEVPMFHISSTLQSKFGIWILVIYQI
jgi:hypothetical protein